MDDKHYMGRTGAEDCTMSFPAGTAGEEVMQYSTNLCIRTAELAAELKEKLSPISREGSSVIKGLAGCKNQLPLYFQALRENLYAIDCALQGIRDSIRNIDL